MRFYYYLIFRPLLPAVRRSLSAFHYTTLCTTLLYAILLYSLPAYSADFSLNPSITVREEYNDNVFETEHKRTDFITRFMPGIAFTYVAPFWDWNVAYNYDYRYYARNTVHGDDTHNLVGAGTIRLLNDFLLLELNDNYNRVSLNLARDRTQESLIANQSDSNNFTASPYLRFHPAPKLTMRTGYRYTNVWYKDPSAIDREDHSGFVDATYELSPRLNLTGDYIYVHENSINPYDRHNPYVGFRYEYKEGSFLFGQGGFAWFSSKNGVASNNPYWNAGITHLFDHLTVSLTTGVQFPYDPLSGVTRETDYGATVTKALNRGTIGLSLSYSEYSGANIDVEKRYSAGITATHELTERLSGTLSCSIEKYDHKTASYTRRIYLNPSLNYALPHEYSIGLNYIFVDSYSPVVSSDKYQVNRVSLELRKSFGKEVAKLTTPDSGPKTGP